jgi:hypothetical protein
MDTRLGDDVGSDDDNGKGSVHSVLGGSHGKDRKLWDVMAGLLNSIKLEDDRGLPLKNNSCSCTSS